MRERFIIIVSFIKVKGIYHLDHYTEHVKTRGRTGMYCQATVYLSKFHPHHPRIPRSFLKIPNSWDNKIGISFVQTKISLKQDKIWTGSFTKNSLRTVGSYTFVTWVLHLSSTGEMPFYPDEHLNRLAVVVGNTSEDDQHDPVSRHTSSAWRASMRSSLRSPFVLFTRKDPR